MQHINLPARRKLWSSGRPLNVGHTSQCRNKFKFLSVENRMLNASSSKKPCTPNFSRLVKAVSQWIRVGLKLKNVPPPRSKPRTSFNLKHYGDESELYTEKEEHNFDHVSNLKYYREQVTASLIHAVCSADSERDLNPLPGSPSYSLSKLDKETKPFVNYQPVLHQANLVENLCFVCCCVGLGSSISSSR